MLTWSLAVRGPKRLTISTASMAGTFSALDAEGVRSPTAWLMLAGRRIVRHAVGGRGNGAADEAGQGHDSEDVGKGGDEGGVVLEGAGLALQAVVKSLAEAEEE